MVKCCEGEEGDDAWRQEAGLHIFWKIKVRESLSGTVQASSISFFVFGLALAPGQFFFSFFHTYGSKNWHQKYRRQKMESI